uniref:Cuticular protein 2 n=1 Tax=Microplitis mediator TaxID=375433 RepID=A0A650DLE8_9HYME|nr:cuticular protein 2 [Microplitis mediator]
MYKLAVILGLVSMVLAAPVDQQSTSEIPIVRESHDGPNPDGSYSWSYEAGNGIQAQEEGSLSASENSKDGALVVRGSYSYTGEDGVQYQIVYVADENGFQPQGAHLPTSPPIPEEILKSLEYNAAHPEENNDDEPKQ